MNRKPTDKTKISVIIAMDDHSHFDETVRALLTQRARDEMEVIVTDGIGAGWGDRASRLAQEAGYGRFSYAEIPRAGRSKCWNIGARRASSGLLLFMADDFIASEGLVEAHLAKHEQNTDEKEVFFGPALFSEQLRSTSFMRWLEDGGSLFGVAFTKPETIPENFFWGANVSMKRALFERAGGFDEDFPYHGWEDYEFGLRLSGLGMRSHYLSDAVAYHEHELTLDERLRTMVQAGESAVIFESKYPGQQPWHGVVKRPSVLWGFEKNIARLKFKLSGNSDDEAAYFSSALNQKFAQGYRSRSKPKR